MRVIFPAEADVAIREVDDAVIGDGDAMRIAGQVMQHVLGSAERWFGIHHPFTWLSAERPTVLFDLVTARLIERKILLPGVTVLTRLVAQIRERAMTRLWQRLAALPDQEQMARLEALLMTTEGEYFSPLDRLRRAPTRISSPALLEALERVAEIRSLGVSGVDLSRFPAGRIKTIARNTATAWAQTLARRRAAARLVAESVLENASSRREHRTKRTTTGSLQETGRRRNESIRASGAGRLPRNRASSKLVLSLPRWILAHYSAVLVPEDIHGANREPDFGLLRCNFEPMEEGPHLRRWQIGSVEVLQFKSSRRPTVLLEGRGSRARIHSPASPKVVYNALHEREGGPFVWWSSC